MEIKMKGKILKSKLYVKSHIRIEMQMPRFNCHVTIQKNLFSCSCKIKGF